MLESVINWVMELAPIWTSLGLFFLLVFALFLGRVVVFFTSGRLEKLAMTAVRVAEFAVLALPTEKWMIALDYLIKGVKSYLGIPLPKSLLKRTLEWALARLKENGEEIKAKDLGVENKIEFWDGKNFRLNRDGFEFELDKRF